MKVYELAKKLEVKSVFLMDKIRKEWKLPVKTHMEALTPEMAKKIEEKFYASKKTHEKKSKKKTAGKTKSPAKKTAVKKESPAKKKSSTAKKPAIKKSQAKTTAVPAKAQTETQTETEKTAPPKRKFIIRRKTEEKKPLESSASTASLSPKTEESTAPTGARSALSKNIRSDLISVKSTDPLDESFWEKEEEPVKKQPKKPIAEKDVSSKFNATDFRKREVIFQPRKKRTALAGEFKSTPITTPKSHKRIIKVHGEMNMENLCKKMGIKKQALIRKLKEEGVDTKGLSILDFETIALVIPSFGFEAKNTKQTEKEVLDLLEKQGAREEKASLSPKPPVVTIMGHVDHGKTTLLDKIRKAKVAEQEAGGITQHIGAYSVPLNDKFITFIDTPGHEAFTAMRARGAQVTDIVVIIVSAPDGVQPQTLEALNHARAAKTPFLIAISKMDASGANPDKIKQKMSEHEVVPEDWGGDISFIPISAVKGDGIKELLEQIQLLAEMQELKCQPSAPAKGVVLEARMEKGLGAVVSLLVRDGTLKSGQTVVAGECLGRIRQMKTDQGKIVKEALPGLPVEAIGFPDLPMAGDLFYTVENEKAARELLVVKKDQSQTEKTIPLAVSPEDLLLKMQLSNKEKQDLNIILKADVGGSLEALKNSLEKIKSDEVSLKIIHSGAGAITESDVLLASTVSGVVFGFNVRPDSKAVKTAKEKSVDIHTHSIIYELLDRVKTLMLGLLKAEFIEEEQGQAEVREIFHISKVGTVAGCYVTKGQIPRSAFIRLIRDGRLVHEGKLSSLKRFKEDVKQVGTGLECGMSLENFNDIKPKDILEAYTKKEKERTEL